MTRLAKLAAVLSLLGSALLGSCSADPPETPQRIANAVAIPAPGALPDGLAGHGLEQLGQQALIRVPDPARPCRFDVLMERQDGRPSAWESADLCHAPEPRPPRASGAASAGQ